MRVNRARSLAECVRLEIESVHLTSTYSNDISLVLQPRAYTAGTEYNMIRESHAAHDRPGASAASATQPNMMGT